jgi:hypothetical protein
VLILRDFLRRMRRRTQTRLAADAEEQVQWGGASPQRSASYLAGGLTDIIQLRVRGIDLGQDVHLNMADRASDRLFQIVKFFLRAGVLAHEPYSRQIGYGLQGQVLYCLRICLFQHGLAIFSVIAGLDTVSRIYPTYGTLKNAELGQARVQVQSTIFARALCEADGPAGQARG